jgi:hypothetical protein
MREHDRVRGARRPSSRVVAALVCALIAWVAWPTAAALAETTVTFADSGLESAVRVALAQPTGDLTEADVSSITTLVASGKSIRDLEGLQHAVGLTCLDLSSNRITDLAPLSGLTSLGDLNLGNNAIATITALGGLHPARANLSLNRLDLDSDSAASAIINGWLGEGASVTYLPQGQPMECVLSTTSRIVGYAARATIAGTLRGLDASASVGGARVWLESSSDGATFVRVGECTTTAEGAFAFTVAPQTTTHYRVVFAGEGCRLCASTSASVVLTPLVFLSTPSTPSLARRSQRFLSSAYLKDRHASGSRPVKMECYRYEKKRGGGRAWVLRATVWAIASNYSNYTRVRASVALRYTGDWRIRAQHPGDSLNATTYSGWRRLHVEDPRIDKAIRWAKRHKGSHSWDHYCLRFANECYKHAGGKVRSIYPDAKTAAKALRASRHRSANAPRGAYVFYHSWHGSTDLGHVGISLGNGTMISDNGDEGVVVRPIKTSRYIGWAAPPVSPRITDWD